MLRSYFLFFLSKSQGGNNFRRDSLKKPNTIIHSSPSKNNFLALALVAGLTSFAVRAKAEVLDAAITTSIYSGLVSFNADGSTNAITTSGL